MGILRGRADYAQKAGEPSGAPGLKRLPSRARRHPLPRKNGLPLPLRSLRRPSPPPWAQKEAAPKSAST